MTFYEIEFPLETLSVESVEAAFLEIGAVSITFVDRGASPVLEPALSEFRLWNDTLVCALFQDTPDAAQWRQARNLGRLAAMLGPHITRTARVLAVENRDWERVWLADWRSMRFGRRLWVCPMAADLPDDPNAVVVRLD